ncbi:MAG: hypothetical protein ACYDD1_12970 [Caulobacteraceae bacterium]
MRQVTKIPTCVGTGPTKTVAKLANKVAKSDRTGPSVLYFSSPDARLQAYPSIGLEDVWGMGRVRAPFLSASSCTVTRPAAEMRS